MPDIQSISPLRMPVSGIPQQGGTLTYPPSSATMVYITASGTWTIPQGASRVWVILLGGGGGGGSGTPASGSGAGASGCSAKLWAGNLGGQLMSFVIGAGGTSFVTTGTGATGGTSTLSFQGVTLTANGGGGGASGTSATGGAGGTATGGDTNYSGGSGGNAASGTASGGAGTVFGGGGGAGGTKGNGVNGANAPGGVVITTAPVPTNYPGTDAGGGGWSGSILAAGLYGIAQPGGGYNRNSINDALAVYVGSYATSASPVPDGGSYWRGGEFGGGSTCCNSTRGGNGGAIIIWD